MSSKIADRSLRYNYRRHARCSQRVHRYLDYSGALLRFFRSTEAIPCTDEGDIWRGWVDLRWNRQGLWAVPPWVKHLNWRIYSRVPALCGFNLGVHFPPKFSASFSCETILQHVQQSAWWYRGPSHSCIYKTFWIGRIVLPLRRAENLEKRTPSLNPHNCETPWANSTKFKTWIDHETAQNPENFVIMA